jgi:hypothetical protein
MFLPAFIVAFAPPRSVGKAVDGRHGPPTGGILECGRFFPYNPRLFAVSEYSQWW